MKVQINTDEIRLPEFPVRSRLNGITRREAKILMWRLAKALAAGQSAGLSVEVSMPTDGSWASEMYDGCREWLTEHGIAEDLTEETP